MNTNLVYRGDCYNVLKRNFPEHCVDLIYLDPPFSLDPKYARLWMDSETIKNFKELSKGGSHKYVEYMSRRLEQCHRVLKDTGSIYLHCDDDFGHYLKVEMDKIFGKNRFRNHITWRREFAKGAKATSNKFPRDSDFILFYTKGDNWTFNKPYIKRKLTPEEARKEGYSYDESTRRWFKTAPRGDYTDKSICKLAKEGRIYTTKNGNVRIIYWAEVSDGKIIDKKLIDDIWTDLPGLMHVSKSERIGYSTQKPKSLLERIISTSSNPQDIILDPMCGCGTTIAVAHELQRKWIGIDLSLRACEEIQKRMDGISETKIKVIGMPLNVRDLKNLSPFDFQDHICDMTNSTKPMHTGDKGIDGFFMGELPIQIKQWEKVGRNAVDNFETALRRRSRNRGIVIGFSFTRGAYEEAARAEKDGLNIRLIQVAELIGRDYNINSFFEGGQ